MAPRRLAYTSPDRFVAGSTGAGAARRFYVQVRDGSTLATVEVSRSVLTLLADHAVAVLDEVARLGGIDTYGSDAAVDIRPLDLPLLPVLTADTAVVSWDSAAGLLTVELTGADQADAVAVSVTPLWARRFSLRVRRLLHESPACPFCAQQVSASGHVCPRLDGLRAQR